jgi:hypothetical protein
VSHGGEYEDDRLLGCSSYTAGVDAWIDEIGKYR